LPYELQTNLRGIRVPDGHGGTQPLVRDEQLLSPNRLQAPPAQAPDLRLPLLALWTLTSHHSAWANANLLLFSPLAFLLLPTLWRMRCGLAPTRFVNGVLMLQLLAVLVAVLLHLLPGTVQQNQPWILFALPVWLALAWSLRQLAPPPSP